MECVLQKALEGSLPLSYSLKPQYKSLRGHNQENTVKKFYQYISGSQKGLEKNV